MTRVTWREACVSVRPVVGIIRICWTCAHIPDCVYSLCFQCQHSLLVSACENKLTRVCFVVLQPTLHVRQIRADFSLQPDQRRQICSTCEEKSRSGNVPRQRHDLSHRRAGILPSWVFYSAAASISFIHSSTRPTLMWLIWGLVGHSVGRSVGLLVVKKGRERRGEGPVTDEVGFLLLC